MTTYSYKLSLNDSEMIMLEEALKMMIEKCEREITLNPRAPFFAHLTSAKALNARLHKDMAQTSGTDTAGVIHLLKGN